VSVRLDFVRLLMHERPGTIDDSVGIECLVAHGPDSSSSKLSAKRSRLPAAERHVK
jgi:hypothetical protein